MKTTLASVAVAALISTGAIATANAAPSIAHVEAGTSVQLVHDRGHRRDGRETRHHRRHEILDPRQIVRKLRYQGYRDIGRMSLSRGDYIVDARRHRDRVRLVVDGRTGRILAREVIRRHHRRDHYRDYGLHYGGSRGNFSYSFTLR